MNKYPEGISRIDSERFVGWLARIYYPGTTKSKGFSDSKYGSSKDALKAAMRWRTAQIAQNPPPIKKPYREKLIASNTSGYNGVSFTHYHDRSGKKVEVVSVSYSIRPNQPRIKKFRLHHYDSPEDALQDALDFRKEMEQKAERIRKAEHLWPYNQEIQK